jgi:hypothetical protein
LDEVRDALGFDLDVESGLPAMTVLTDSMCLQARAPRTGAS